MAKKEPSAKTSAAKKPSAAPMKAPAPNQARADTNRPLQKQATPKTAAGKPAAAPAKAPEPKAAASAVKRTPQAAKPDAMIKAVGAPGAEPPKAAKPAASKPETSKPAPNVASPQHAKLAIDQAIDEAREAVFSVGGQFGSARPGADPAVSDEHAAAIASLTNLNTKLIAAFRANAEATLDHVQAIANVRSISQLVELNGRFVRDQLLAFNAQAKEIATASFEVVNEAGKPRSR